MWNALPLFGYLFPSPMWSLKRDDAVVLLSRLPPDVEYFSFTTFALFMPSRGLPFSSLGDSVNNLNIKTTESGLFAHVTAANAETFSMVKQALVDSGLSASAINLVALPTGSEYGIFDEWTHFETVLRLFKFADQAEGNAYLQSNHPVYYLSATHGKNGELPMRGYKDRAHPDNFHEPKLGEWVSSATVDPTTQRRRKNPSNDIEGLSFAVLSRSMIYSPTRFCWNPTTRA
jgi:hypothetical protein